jgi:hypothetical protein
MVSSSLVTADVGALHFSRYIDNGSTQIISLFIMTLLTLDGIIVSTFAFSYA